MPKQDFNITELYEYFTEYPVISTDTRNIKPESIFFALKGENFNGNKFALQSLELGAKYAVVDEDCGDDIRLIHVKNVLECLQDLATYHREKMNIPVIAIAGSNGKTTTKELLFQTLSKKYKTWATPGNFNNHIGVPLTLLQLQKTHEMAVVELGTNSPGEIEMLCKIAKPNFGIITNIGKEHLEGFGDLEGVLKEETALFDYLKNNNGIAFVNQNESMINKAAENLPKKYTYTFSEGNKTKKSNADCTFILHQTIPEIEWQFADKNLIGKSSLSGTYNFQNIATAAAIAHYFEVSEQDILEAISEYIPSNKRSQWIQKRNNHILLDCYNANPSSMEVALEAFSKLEKTNKIIIVGDMLEMGNHAEAEHKNIALLIKKLGFETVFSVGEIFGKFADIMDSTHFETSQKLGDYLEKIDLENAWVLLKASRGIALEKSIENLPN